MSYKEIILIVLAVTALILFLILNGLYISFKKENCEQAGGILVKSATIGFECVAKIYSLEEK